MKPWLHVGATFCAALLMAACNGPAGDGDSSRPSMTASQTRAALDGLASDGQQLEGRLSASSTFDAVSSLVTHVPTWTGGSSGPTSQAHTDGDLPRGEYEYDEAASTWSTVDANASDLILHWAFTDASSERRAATAKMDWDANQTATAVVRAAPDSDATIEVPREARATLNVDAATVGALDGEVDWRRAAGCDAVAQPTRLALDGSLEDSGAAAAMDASASLAEDGRFQTRGSLTATSGGSRDASLDWDVSTAGDLETTGCFWSGYTVSSGSVELALALGDRAASLAFAFSELRRDAGGGLDSVVLTDGRLAFDGTTAVTFEGTLADRDEDGIPGEQVQLRFADVTLDLEQFVRQELAATFGASRGLASLF